MARLSLSGGAIFYHVVRVIAEKIFR